MSLFPGAPMFQLLSTPPSCAASKGLLVIKASVGAARRPELGVDVGGNSVILLRRRAAAAGSEASAPARRSLRFGACWLSTARADESHVGEPWSGSHLLVSQHQ